MKALFPESSRPAGKESEMLISRLDPIIQQTDTLGIAVSQRPFVLYFLLTANSLVCIDCNKLQLKSITLESMVDEMNQKVLFDSEI